MSIVRSELKKKAKKESKEWTEMKKRKYFKKGIFDQSGTMSSHILQLLVFFLFWITLLISMRILLLSTEYLQIKYEEMGLLSKQ